MYYLNILYHNIIYYDILLWLLVPRASPGSAPWRRAPGGLYDRVVSTIISCTQIIILAYLRQFDQVRKWPYVGQPCGAPGGLYTAIISKYNSITYTNHKTIISTIISIKYKHGRMWAGRAPGGRRAPAARAPEPIWLQQ